MVYYYPSYKGTSKEKENLCKVSMHIVISKIGNCKCTLFYNLNLKKNNKESRIRKFRGQKLILRVLIRFLYVIMYVIYNCHMKIYLLNWTE